MVEFYVSVETRNDGAPYAVATDTATLDVLRFNDLKIIARTSDREIPFHLMASDAFLTFLSIAQWKEEGATSGRAFLFEESMNVMTLSRTSEGYRLEAFDASRQEPAAIVVAKEDFEKLLRSVYTAYVRALEDQIANFKKIANVMRDVRTYAQLISQTSR